MFKLYLLRRWCRQNSDVINMADGKEEYAFQRCECGIYFATDAAARSHRCTQQGQLQPYAADQRSRTMFQCEKCKNFFVDMDDFNMHPCATNSRAESGVESSSCSGLEELRKEKGTGIWNSNQTLLLIQLYRENIKLVDSGKIRKKAMWEKISCSLKEKGYDFTVDQISGRWKSLMRAYKTTKDTNKRSGSGRKTYEFEAELDELFAEDPSIEPEATLSSSSQSTSKRSAEEADQLEIPKKKRRSNTSELVDLFKTHLEDQKERDRDDRERREQMHTERLQVMNNLIAAISANKATK